MVSDPLAYIKPMADAGADGFTFHVEAAEDPLAVVDAIRAAERPMKARGRAGTSMALSSTRVEGPH